MKESIINKKLQKVAKNLEVITFSKKKIIATSIEKARIDYNKAKKLVDTLIEKSINARVKGASDEDLEKLAKQLFVAKERMQDAISAFVDAAVLETRKKIKKSVKKKAGSYKFQMNRKEMKSLAWLADRYESARVIYDNMHLADESDEDADVQVWEIPEHALWDAYEATKEDGGNLGVIPNLGGRLGKEIHNLFKNMV